MESARATEQGVLGAGTSVVKDHAKDDTISLKANDSPHEHVETKLPQHEGLEEAINDPEWGNKNRQLVRRLDMTLMPMVWILYFHNYLDRNNIA